MSSYCARRRGMTQERPPPRIRWYGPALRGWLACDADQPISVNPHDPETPEWDAWRQGWFARNRGEDAVENTDRWDDLPTQ